MERRARRIARFDPREYRSTGRAPTRGNNNNNNNTLFEGCASTKQTSVRYLAKQMHGSEQQSASISRNKRENPRVIENWMAWLTAGRRRAAIFPIFLVACRPNRRADSPLAGKLDDARPYLRNFRLRSERRTRDALFG